MAEFTKSLVKRQAHANRATSPCVARLHRIGLAVLLIVFGGCRSTHQVHEASTLPVHYRAIPSDQPPRVLSSLAPPVAWDSNLIYPGDVLEVSVVTGVEEQIAKPIALRVDPRGNISLPPVGLGVVPVAGLTLTDAERAIRDASVDRQIYIDPSISVVLKSRSTQRVTVTGAVNKPGTYDLPAGGNNLLAALIAAGDLSETAGTMVSVVTPDSPGAPAVAQTEDGTALVQYRQPSGNSVRTDFDLVEGTAGDVRLQDGSVVTVPARVPGMVSINGLVNKPGRYELPETGPFRLLDAIAEAEGATMEIADKVTVTRYVPGRSDPIRIEASMRKAERNSRENLILAAGDTVRVNETWSTFLFGFTGNFLRIGLSTPLSVN